MRNEEKITAEVKEEINDTSVMVLWWNEAVENDRYEISARNLNDVEIRPEGFVIIRAVYDRHIDDRVDLYLNTVSFCDIPGVMDCQPHTKTTWRVTTYSDAA